MDHRHETIQTIFQDPPFLLPSSLSMVKVKYQPIMPLRKYEKFPGNNQFWCCGALMSSKQIGILVFCAIIIIVVSALYFAFEYVIHICTCMYTVHVHGYQCHVCCILHGWRNSTRHVCLWQCVNTHHCISLHINLYMYNVLYMYTCTCIYVHAIIPYSARFLVLNVKPIGVGAIFPVLGVLGFYFSMSFLFKTGCIDAGIVPRALPDEVAYMQSKGDEGTQCTTCTHMCTFIYKLYTCVYKSCIHI